MLLACLLFVAVFLTCAMFFSKNMMLGFPSVIFWAIAGGHCYTLSTGAWADIYYFMFFACTLGMTVFCALAMYGLRPRDDISPAMEEHTYIDEKNKKETEPQEPDYDMDETPPSRRVVKLRQRAAERRSGIVKSKVERKWDEFKP